MRYPRDPYWLTSKYGGKCSKCGKAVRKGERIFYYPNTKSVLCAGDSCGGQASRDFEAARFDESVYAGGKRRRGGKARKPILAWKRPANLNELWEAAAPGGGRYVIRMIGAYRTGATRYEVNLTGTAYSNAYLGQAKTSDGAKRMAAAHANRRAARAQTVAVGPTTRGPWDSGGKRRRGGKRRAARGAGLIAAARALRDIWK